MTKFKELTVKDSTYEYAFDDGCIVLKVGNNTLWIDPIILPKLAELAKELEGGINERTQKETT